MYLVSFCSSLVTFLIHDLIYAIYVVGFSLWFYFHYYLWVNLIILWKCFIYYHGTLPFFFFYLFLLTCMLCSHDCSILLCLVHISSFLYFLIWMKCMLCVLWDTFYIILVELTLLSYRSTLDCNWGMFFPFFLYVWFYLICMSYLSSILLGFLSLSSLLYSCFWISILYQSNVIITSTWLIETFI